MNRPLVFDACTVINLLSIDDDDCLLLKAIRKATVIDEKVNFFIAEFVENEIKVNLIKRFPDKDNRDVLMQKLRENRVLYYNNDIINDLSTDFWDQIKDFAHHTKRENGELYSTALALLLSRLNKRRVTFYTDDYPAKEEFYPFFRYQQIGSIEDTVDLLLFLHWSNENFTLIKLISKLRDLKAYYIKDLYFIRTFVEEQLKNKPKKDAQKHLNALLEAYSGKLPFSESRIQDAIKYIESKWHKEGSQIRSSILNMPPIATKIDVILSNIKKMNIYKL